MGVPSTTGNLVTSLDGMKTGDYIVCKYVATASTVGTFSELGISAAVEIPVLGSNVPNGTFYFVKSAKGLLIGDRVVQHTFTWDAMNTGKIIQGKPTTLGTTNGVIRSLTGGVAYADTNGNMSLTDKSLGAFPTNNEWDRYIVNFPTDKIQSGKTLDDVWHFNGIHTWCQDTSINNMINPYQTSVIGSNIQRILRGSLNVKLTANVASNSSGIDRGFRPVFEYKEV